MAPLDLKGNTFDLAKEKATLPGDASKTNYILLEFKDHPKQDDFQKLDEAKVSIEEFVGNETYLCHYDPTDLKPLEKLSFVKNVVVYPAKVKISPELQQAVQADTANAPPRMIQVHLHDAFPGGAAKVLEQFSATTKPTIHAQTDEIILMTVELKFVKNLAELDGVRSIGLEYPISFESVVARGIMGADAIQVPHNDQQLNGEGQIITVADGGFDKGNILDVHPAFTGRVRNLISVGRKGTTFQTNDSNGHGTHVAGCCLGDGNSAETGPVRGTAPRAELVVQSLWDPVLKGMNPLFRADRIDEAIGEGSYIMNNSYAVREAKDPYDAHTSEVDAAIYRNPDFVAVYGSGNWGEEGGVINAGAGSKNGITVGASFSSRPLGPRIKANRLSHWSYNAAGGPGDPRSVAGFSNTGPAASGRIKPDVVAPGVAILSAASRDPAFQPPNKSINNYGPAPNNLYCYMSGTSMATPLVTGCVAVIRQALLRYRQPTLHPPDARPKAALIKALLIHGARDLKGGNYQDKAISEAPNFIQGHGIVDLNRSLEPVIDLANPIHGIWEDQASVLEQPVIHENRTPVVVQDPNNPQPVFYDLNATLVYTDFAGRQLQNELMLEIATLEEFVTQHTGAVRAVGDNVLRLKKEGIHPDTRVQIRVVPRRLFSIRRPVDFAVVWSFNRTP